MSLRTSDIVPISEELRRRMTLEAMADVDAGQAIDHQSVQAWADSLGADQPLPPPCNP